MKPLLLSKKMNKMKIMIKIKRWAMIKGQLSKINMKMNKRSQDHHPSSSRS
jgi:hypothetical protein